MKKITTIIVLILIGSLAGHSQNFYLRGGLGAAISTSPHLWYQYTSSGSDSSYTSSTEAKKNGLGDGLPFVVAAGYNISANFAVELGVDYFMGFTHKIESSGSNSSSTVKINGSMLSIVPAFVIKIPMQKFSPYARLGIIIGVLNNEKTKYSAKITSESSPTTMEYTSKDYGGIAVGAQAALGTDLRITNHFSLFGEIKSDGISWAPKKGKYTKSSRNGVDDLASLTTREKTWVYKKKIDSSTTTSESDPDQRNMVNYSFTNTGIVVGVKFVFGK